MPAKLPAWWRSGKTGSLSPWSQAKVWALHVVSEDKNLNLTHDDIAGLVTKVGGGRPGQQAISKYRAMFDRDPEWCPGKENENAKKRGPKPMLTQHKKLCIAASAMALKDEGKEPNVPDIVARTPVASLNPRTGAPFTDKYILQVFRTLCYDKDPANPWGTTLHSLKQHCRQSL